MMKLSTKLQRWLSTPTNSFLRQSRNGFLVIGIVTLSYVGYVLLDTWLYQAEQARQFEQALKVANPARVESPGVPVSEGSSLGRIKISRLGLSAMIQEGVNEKTLRHAVGHIPDTPLPGQRGNVALAGHRDTSFRELRQIRQADEITLTTLSGTYRYRVEATQVVAPEETQVLDATADDMLTLVTCYPFNFVGSAPKRFIVRAQRIPR